MGCKNVIDQNQLINGEICFIYNYPIYNISSAVRCAKWLSNPSSIHTPDTHYIFESSRHSHGVLRSEPVQFQVNRVHIMRFHSPPSCLVQRE